MAGVEVPRVSGQASGRGGSEIEPVANGPAQGLGHWDFGPAADPGGNARGDGRISKHPVLDRGIDRIQLRIVGFGEMRVDGVEDFERGFVTYDPMRQQAWKPRSIAGRSPHRKKIPSQGGIDAMDAVRRGVEHTAPQARNIVGNRKFHRGKLSPRTNAPRKSTEGQAGRSVHFRSSIADAIMGVKSRPP